MNAHDMHCNTDDESLDTLFAEVMDLVGLPGDEPLTDDELRLVMHHIAPSANGLPYATDWLAIADRRESDPGCTEDSSKASVIDMAHTMQDITLSDDDIASLLEDCRNGVEFRSPRQDDLISIGESLAPLDDLPSGLVETARLVAAKSTPGSGQTALAVHPICKDADRTSGNAAVAKLQLLAECGTLAQTVQTCPPAERKILAGAAFTLVWPIVFHRLTRVYELRRGHHSCALGVDRLDDDCLDRFHEDVEAVVEYLLTRATTRIPDAESWIASRLRAVTLDAHRRRRGARGALQRPRLPGWLARRLDSDVWLTQLAIKILLWVGVPTTADPHLWPLDAWAEQRIYVTGDVHGSDTRAVQRDVDRVLREMKARPKWYAEYVERPLGAKTPLLVPAGLDSDAIVAELPLILTQQHEVKEARLADLASLALRTIETQLAANPGDQEAIGRIIMKVFGRIDYAAEAAEPPFAATGGDRLDSPIDDPTQLSHIADVVRAIIAGRDHGV